MSKFFFLNFQNIFRFFSKQKSLFASLSSGNGGVLRDLSLFSKQHCNRRVNLQSLFSSTGCLETKFLITALLTMQLSFLKITIQNKLLPLFYSGLPQIQQFFIVESEKKEEMKKNIFSSIFLRKISFSLSLIRHQGCAIFQASD